MAQERSLEIAILGTRGIPACYGGFETFAEELSARLVQRGHSVVVYGRRGFAEKYRGPATYRGALLRILPTVRHKYLETPLHGLFSVLDCAIRGCDAVILCNAANSPFAWLLRVRGIAVAINVDGVERKRGKWNILGRLWYRLGEICSVLFASRVIADAQVIAQYYRRSYGCRSEVIAYGAEPRFQKAGAVLRQFNLKAGEYILYVSRLEPENNALGVIQAYNGLVTKMPLVLVGGAPYAKAYYAKLRAAANGNVIFTGFQFGQAYRELRSNCYLYIQATEVGGTHPALVEAMAYGNCVIANATPEHLEVLGPAGVYYSKNDFPDLGRKMKMLLADPQLVQRYGEMGRVRAAELYDWGKITERYELLLARLAGRAGD